MKSNTKSSITLPTHELRLVNELQKRLRARSKVEVVRRGLLLLKETVDREALRAAYAKASADVRASSAEELDAFDALANEGLDEMKVSHGALYAADLSPRIGTEPGKVRPVIVLQTDLLNAVGHPSTWIIPCTTRLTGSSILRVSLPRGIAGNTSDCEAMIDQSRAIDNRRLKRRLGALPAPILREVKEKIRKLGEL